jgi:hypothetical protein
VDEEVGDPVRQARRLGAGEGDDGAAPRGRGEALGADERQLAREPPGDDAVVAPAPPAQDALQLAVLMHLVGELRGPGQGAGRPEREQGIGRQIVEQSVRVEVLPQGRQPSHAGVSPSPKVPMMIRMGG